MELNEAVLRILRHSRLILAVVLVCLAIPLLSSWTHEDTYAASARVSFGADPTNDDEAAAMVDAAEAIVTTPGAVESALGGLVADRDPARVEDQVDVESVGVSGVLTISVSDTDPEVATAVANGLARRVIAARRELVVEPVEDRLAEVDRLLASAREDIRAITGASGGDAATIDSRRLLLDAALSRQSGLRAEHASLITTLAAMPTPSFVSRATVPPGPEPSGLAADLVVAGLLGLIIGVALTAAIEALRPTIVGGDALANTLGAPVLGRIPNPSVADDGVSDSRVALTLALAARSARVEVVHLTSTGSAIDLLPLAERLVAGAPDLTVDAIGAAPDPPSRPGSPARTGTEGLVVVAAEVQPRSALRDVEQLILISQWPLVGIITYPSSIWRRQTTRRPVRSILLRGRAALASMIDRHRRTPEHAGVAARSKPVPQPSLRLRRLVRIPWGSETRS